MLELKVLSGLAETMLDLLWRTLCFFYPVCASTGVWGNVSGLGGTRPHVMVRQGLPALEADTVQGLPCALP